MKIYFTKAQATIEFTLAFVTAILFLVLTCNLFVWLNHDLVRRQRAYEESRVRAASGTMQHFIVEGTTVTGDPGKLDFYRRKPMNLFTPGGYNR